jgi:hypothetical protein
MGDRTPKSDFDPPYRQVKSDNPDKFDQETVAWQFCLLDWEHEHWGFNQLLPKQWRDLRNALAGLEGLTWSAIKQAVGGRGTSGGTNHHSLDVRQICARAYKRLEELKLEDIDAVFSLRINNILRIYGIRDGRVFRLLWYDCHHDNKNAVYLTKKFRKRSDS